LIRSRRLGAYALVVYFVGLVSGIIERAFNAAGMNAAPIIPLSDVLLLVGIVLAVVAATTAGASTRRLTIVGVIFGIGNFFVGEQHEVQLPPE